MYTKAVLREQPEAGSLVEWSREWFSQRVAERGEPSRESTPFSPKRGSLISLSPLSHAPASRPALATLPRPALRRVSSAAMCTAALAEAQAPPPAAE